MGLDWGMTIRQRENAKVKIDLFSACGWNSKQLMDRVAWMSEKTPFEHFDYDGKPLENVDDYYKIVNLKDFLAWSAPLEELNKLAVNMSNRVRQNSNFWTDEQSNKYADICFDLDIDADEFVFDTLLRLYTVRRVLLETDCFNTYDDKNTVVLELWGSW